MANRYNRPMISRARQRAGRKKQLFIGGGALAALAVIVLVILLLQKGGGPALTGKLMLLLLDKKKLQGSTGILTMQEGRIRFYPNGSESPSADRSLIYTKARG